MCRSYWEALLSLSSLFKQWARSYTIGEATVPVPLPQGKNIGTGVGVGWGSMGSDWQAPWVSIRWSRLSSQVLFDLLFSPEIRYSARPYFTTEIIFQVRCAREVIPYYAALGIHESLATGPCTLSSCLLRVSSGRNRFRGSTHYLSQEYILREMLLVYLYMRQG